VLASPETATDGDYAAILGVVGHEVHTFINIIAISLLDHQKVGGANCTYCLLLLQYFHNWTGNR
jgi:hypothetical protein